MVGDILTVVSSNSSLLHTCFPYVPLGDINDDITSALFCSEYGSVQNVVQDGAVQNVGPKKRRRRDSSTTYMENNKELTPGSMPVEVPKRNALEIGKNIASSDLNSYSEYHSEGNKPLTNKSNSPGRMQKLNSSDNAAGAECASLPKISSKDVSLPSSEIKDLDKHKTAVAQAVDFARKSTTNAINPYPGYYEKDAGLQLDLQLKKSSNVVKPELPKKMRQKEIYGANQFPGTTTAGNVYPTQTTVRIRGTDTFEYGAIHSYLYVLVVL